jgi:hypothetical protein
MKKLLLLLLLPMTLFCIPPYDVMKDLNVNECMNDIYYINDMFVLRKDAEKHLQTLQDTIRNTKFNGNKKLMNDVINVELLYNYSAKEKFGDTFIARLFDKMEANMQTASST